MLDFNNLNLSNFEKNWVKQYEITEKEKVLLLEEKFKRALSFSEEVLRETRSKDTL